MGGSQQSSQPASNLLAPWPSLPMSPGPGIEPSLLLHSGWESQRALRSGLYPDYPPPQFSFFLKPLWTPWRTLAPSPALEIETAAETAVKTEPLGGGGGGKERAKEGRAAYYWPPAPLVLYLPPVSGARVGGGDAWD